MPAPPGPPGCSRPHLWACRSLLLVLAATVLVSGFAAALGRPRWSLWPWNRAWYVFAWDTGRFHQIVVEGELADGTRVAVDLSAWFEYPVAFATRRCDEVPRRPDAMVKLARFVCRRYNQTAPPGRRLVRIDIADVSYPLEPGRRRRLDEVPRSQKQVRLQVEGLACPDAAPGAIPAAPPK